MVKGFYNITIYFKVSQCEDMCSELNSSKNT